MQHWRKLRNSEKNIQEQNGTELQVLLCLWTLRCCMYTLKGKYVPVQAIKARGGSGGSVPLFNLQT
jgi:hypothetical protein